LLGIVSDVGYGSEKMDSSTDKIGDRRAYKSPVQVLITTFCIIDALFLGTSYQAQDPN
jgi:hypothetical protein